MRYNNFVTAVLFLLIAAIAAGALCAISVNWQALGLLSMAVVPPGHKRYPPKDSKTARFVFICCLIVFIINFVCILAGIRGN